MANEGSEWLNGDVRHYEGYLSDSFCIFITNILTKRIWTREGDKGWIEINQWP